MRILQNKLKTISLLTVLGSFMVTSAVAQKKEDNSNVKTFEYENVELNYEQIMELPLINEFKSGSIILASLKKEFNKRVSLYETYILKNSMDSKYPISLNLNLDTTYTFKNCVILFYDIYAENIPMFNSSHWVETFAYDINTGEEVKFNLCELIGCNRDKIPLYKIVNLKIKEESCRLIENDNFILKIFIPLNNGSFIIPVWDGLAKDVDTCSEVYSTRKIEFSKSELLKIITSLK